MHNRRRIQREDRRRRVLRDESTAKKPSGSRSRDSSAGRWQLYVEDAVAGAQPRITDFVPRRKYTLFLWLMSCLVPAALVQTLYVWRVECLEGAWLENTAALRLVGASTIATWFSSMLLMLAGLVALTIYCVRRHRLDDYRGRYQLWLWAAGFCAFCSLDSVAALHRIIQSAMIYLTATKLAGDGSVWWMIVLGSVGALILLRVILDTWRSRGTLLYLTLSIACYVSAVLFHRRVFRIGPGEVDMMAYVGSLMAAHVLLVFALLVYARFVCREAAGEIAADAQRKRNIRESKRAGRLSSRKNRNTPATKKPTGRVETDEEFEDGYEEVDHEDLEDLELLTDPNLPKSEVRKRRKKKRQQRRAA